MLDYNEDKSANLNTFWQSVTWDHLGSRPQVNVTILFNRRFIIEDNIVVTFKSARPQQMIIDKSVDFGLTWSVLQYYNASCKQSIDDGLAVHSVSRSNPDSVICTEAYSSDYPYSDGQVLMQNFECA